MITMALKITPATTGMASQRNTRQTRPLPTTRRASHVGVASSSSGGMKYDSTMCWSMWAE